MAKNYFDKNGNYINNENLSLAEIYHRAFALGVESTPIRIEPDKFQEIFNEYKEAVAEATCDYDQYTRSRLELADAFIELMEADNE